MAKISTVLFDLDGTIIDTYAAILESLQFATREVLGAALPDQVLIAKVGQPLQTQMESFTSNPTEQAEIMRLYRQHNETGLNEKIRPFDGISTLFDDLIDEGYLLGIVTSKRVSVAKSSLEHFDLYNKLQCLIGMDDCTEHKPKPQPLYRAAEKLRVPVENCIYVGDSPYDLQAAQAAGIMSVGVTYGKFFPKEVLLNEHPTAMIDASLELLDVLTVLSSRG